MVNNHIPKARCSDCDAWHRHTSPPQKVRGMIMQPGFRYCMWLKRPRCFRSQDPKIKVPQWCPKRLVPTVLRIYGFKDANAQHVYDVLGGIYAHRYAVRYTGTTRQNANSILKDGISEDLRIAEGEVLEIDDGILPIFAQMTGGCLQVTYFAKERIQKK